MAAERKVTFGPASQKVQLNGGELSSFSLSPHDINVISIVARRPDLPKKDLLRLVDSSAPSDHARDIVYLILGKPVPATTPGLAHKKIIANNYVFWATHHLTGSKVAAVESKPSAAKQVSGRLSRQQGSDWDLSVRKSSQGATSHMATSSVAGRSHGVGKRDIHVIPHKDGWAVKKEGSERASSVHERKADAMVQARIQGRRERVEVVAHRRDGTIRGSNSYGNDPNPPKDKKR